MQQNEPTDRTLPTAHSASAERPEHESANPLDADRNPKARGKLSVQTGPDVEAAQSLDESLAADLTNQQGEHAERMAERDERGRI